MKIGYRLDPDDVWRIRYDTRPQSSSRHFATQVVCTLRRICVCFLLSRHPLFPPFRFHFILLALRRPLHCGTCLVRADTWAHHQWRHSHGHPCLSGMGVFLRSYSSPSSTKTIPHLARMACFIIILLITFCHDPATDHRLFRDPYPFREIIKLSRG